MKTNTSINKVFIEKYLNENFIGNLYDLTTDGQKVDILPDKEYDFMCSDCPESWINDNKTIEQLFDPELTYKLNNFSYRSENFNSEKSSENLLFSGCSFTYGIGVPYDSTWAYMLNESLGYKNFYNLGMGGGSFESIIFDIYTYIKKFGLPQGLIVLFPPPIRVMTLEDKKQIRIVPFRVIHMKEKEEKKFFRENKDLLDYDLWILKFYHMVTALELFLEKLGVKFIWGCWDFYVNKVFKNVTGLKNYIDIYGPDYGHFVSAVENNEIDYSDYVNKYWQNARDTHPSVKEQFLFYKVFEKAWNDKFHVEHLK